MVVLCRRNWWDIWEWCCTSTWERSTPRYWEVSLEHSRASSTWLEWQRWRPPSRTSCPASHPSSRTGQCHSCLSQSHLSQMLSTAGLYFLFIDFIYCVLLSLWYVIKKLFHIACSHFKIGWVMYSAVCCSSSWLHSVTVAIGPFVTGVRFMWIPSCFSWSESTLPNTVKAYDPGDWRVISCD